MSTGESVSFSDSGGVEGSVKSLKLPSKGGGKLTFYYEHYEIPDRFIIRYDGRTYLDTGFTGGNASGSFTIEAGKSDTLSIVTATRDPGTLWNYSVTFEAEDCLPPPPYVIDATKEFEHADGFCEVLGDNVTVGRSDGYASLLGISGGRTRFSDDKASKRLLDVDAATIYAGLGDGRVLFSGSFVYDFKTHSTVALFERGTRQDDFALAGLEVEFKGLSMRDPHALKAAVSFVLPSELGSLAVNVALFNKAALTFSSSGASFGSGFDIDFKKRDVSPIPGLYLTLDKMKMNYSAYEDTLKFNGEVKIKSLIQGFTNPITLDFTGDNGIQYNIRDGLDVVGKASIVNPFTLGQVKLKDVSFTFDTKQNSYVGEGKFLFPFFSKEISLGLTFVTKPTLALDAVKVGLSGLDTRVFQYPVWLDSATGKIENLAASAKDPIKLTGTFGFDVFTSNNSASYHGALTASISYAFGESRFTGKADFKFSGTDNLKVNGDLVLDWGAGIFSLAGGFDIGKGSVTGNGKIVFSTSGATIAASTVVDAEKLKQVLPGPLSHLIGGEDFGARFIGTFTVDGNESNDYLAAGLKLGGLNVGVRYNFNTGQFGLVGYDDIESASSSSKAALAAMAEGTFTVSANARSVLAIASWQNAAGDVDITLTRPDGVVIGEADFARYGIRQISDLTTATSFVLELAKPLAGQWSLDIESPTSLGQVETDFLSSAHVSKLVASEPFLRPDGELRISLNGADLDPDATVQLFVDNNATGADGTAVTGALRVGDLLTATNGNRIIQWMPTDVPAGKYYTYVVLNDPNGAPQTSYSKAPVALGSRADLVVSLVPKDPDWVPGEPATYVVKVANTGAYIADDVVLKLDAGTAYLFDNSFGSYSFDEDGNYTIALGDIAGSKFVAGTVTFQTYTSSTRLSVRAEVETKAFEPDLSDNKAVVSRGPAEAPAADLELRVKILTEPTVLDDEYVYQIVVVNNGTATAKGIEVAGFASAIPGSVTGPGTVANSAANGGTGLSIALGELAAGKAAAWTVKGTPIIAGTYRADLRVTHAGSDPNEANDAKSINFDVAPAPIRPADVSVAIEDGFGSFNTGSARIVVNNATNSVAENVVVQVVATKGFGVTGVTVSQGTFDVDTGIWHVGNVIPEGNPTLTLSGAAAGRIAVVAEVVDMGSVDADSIPGNGALKEDDYAKLILTLPAVQNAAPTALNLSRLTATDGETNWSATLSMTDADAGDAFTYRIVGPDNGFQIYGDTLYASSDAFDFEAGPKRSVTIHGQDRFGYGIDKTFTIAIGNVAGNTKVGTSGDDGTGFFPYTYEEDKFLGGAGNDAIGGGYGNDKLYGGADDDTLDGGSGNDTLQGDAGNDQLYGEDGDDILIGGAGGDVLYGWRGTDTVIYGGRAFVDLADGSRNAGEALGDTFYEIERFRMSKYDDRFFGGAGVDEAHGGDGKDILFGREDDDWLEGDAGNDFLRGDDGNDLLVGGTGADTLQGGIGTDTARFSGPTTLNLADRSKDAGEAVGDTFSSIEIFEFGNGTDAFTGSDSAETVRGGGGNDTLQGMGGNDRLVGGTGRDILDGGIGGDVFAFETLADSGVAAADRDQIRSFSRANGDLIDLQLIDARPLLPGDQDFNFIGTAAFSQAGQVRFFQEGNTTVVQLNADGDADVEMAFVIKGVLTLVATDFVL